MKTVLFHTTLLFMLLCVPLLHAQGLDDAIFNSQTYYEGTSRSMAMGGATGAVGGDVTAVCINPAGMGLYRAQEFTFTTGLQHTFIHSNYYGNSEIAGKMRMNIPNMGLIFASQFSNYNAVRFVQFGIGFTRTNDFNYNSTVFGLNPNSSMVDAYLQTIDGIDDLFNPSTNVGDYLDRYHPYDLSPAWETYLFDQMEDSLGIFYTSPIPQGNIYQKDEVSSKGRSEEWTFALSTNIYDKLFIGTSISASHLKRITKRVYTETPADPNDLNNTFYSWNHAENLGDTAWGVNAKVGIIYFPARWLRLGAAWHTPTLYSFGENWETETGSVIYNNPDGVDYHHRFSPTLYQTYEFRTPQKFIGSMTFFLDHGLISTDVEYMNYGSSMFKKSGDPFSDVNNNIKDYLKPTFNIRLGTEWRLWQYFLRGGVAYYGSPYGFGEDFGSVKKLALGFGYAFSEGSSWDFAYELTEATSGYTPYSYYDGDENLVNAAIQHRWRNKLMVTLKCRIE